MSRLHIDVGQAHDVTPRALVGAITGESGIPGRSVGAIDIQNNFSIVEISAELAAHVHAQQGCIHKRGQGVGEGRR